jgi:predicted NodU family carbamoyl transferase
MNIVGYKNAGHDGAVCCIEDGELVYCIEGEKDSGERRSLLKAGDFERILERRKTTPSVICSDSHEFESSRLHYRGPSLDDVHWSSARARGQTVEFAAVPHELAHITCAFALSDLPEGQEFYALTWEGFFGSLYHVSKDFAVTKMSVMDYVGVRYSFPYHGTSRDWLFGHSAAGKIMALSGLADENSAPSPEIQELVAFFLDSDVKEESYCRVLINGDRDILYAKLEHLRDVPVESPAFVSLCKALQDAIFERFHEFAKKHVSKRLPLVISGGCGLNCDWNTRWRNSGLFTSVFVPPVPSDCGIAIGTAAAANYLKTGKMKLRWNAHLGESFVVQEGAMEDAGFVEVPLDLTRIADGMLNRDWVLAWVHGRYEMGPRALCHRSLIAAPFKSKIRDRLNDIKKREYFRPVAPACREEEVSEHFEWQGESPYMLYFQKVRTPELRAITHADRSARAQTIRAAQDPETYALLCELKKQSGFGVTCNTSLNFLGKGFINRSTDLAIYAASTGLDGVVVDDRMFMRSRMLRAKQAVKRVLTKSR